MLKKLVLIKLLLSASLLLAACAPAAATQETMMEEKPTKAMAEEAVPATGSDAMMEKTATPEMMKDTQASMDDGMQKTGTPEMMDKKSDTMMGTETPQAAMSDTKEEMMAPAWFATRLTDEVSGEAFAIEDFKGKVVLVQNFAQWCSTCLSQAKQIEKLDEMLGMPDNLVLISLNIDPNEDSAMLKKYLEKNGFDWRYAITPAETAREIGNLYGAQFLNPPSAPMMIIDRHGEVHPLPFGLKSADDLQEALKPFLSEGM